MEHLYVLGHPVAHSKSPAMHNAAYRALGLDWEYGLMDCASQGEARAFLAEGEWLACNITMPYKPLAFAVAQRRSIAATLAAGANVLVKTPDGLLADNTDGAGCVGFLGRCGVLLAGKRVVICGTGPTARSIMHACGAAGAAAVTLMGRDAARAQRAVATYLAELGRLSEAPADAFAFNDASRWEAIRRAARETAFAGSSYGEGHEALASADVIIDATSLGMNPGDPAPFDVELLSASHVVLDVVYGHGETALMAGARARGCAAYDGVGMLVGQAVETVRDLASATGLFEIPANVDLFDVMAGAASGE